MYGFNRYAQGQKPGTTRFARPDGSSILLPAMNQTGLQGGVANLADRLRTGIDNQRVMPQLGAAAGQAANAAAAGVPRPSVAGPAAGQAAAFAAQHAGRPRLPGGTPDYALGAGAGGTPPGTPQYAPGQAPMLDPQTLINQLGAGASQGAPRPAAPGQAPMINPQAMVDTLQTNINPANYQAHPLNGKNVLLRNGADPTSPRPGDVMVYENGQWIDGGADLGQELYDQLHIPPDAEMTTGRGRTMEEKQDTANATSEQSEGGILGKVKG